jgi:predicted GNAT family acetyltransferase
MNGDYAGGISYQLISPTKARIQYAGVDSAVRKKGYGNLLYSELIERLRGMGVREVSGTVVDDRGRPISIRRRIIDEVNRKTGYPTTDVIEETSGYRYVKSYLNPEAHYMPAEGWRDWQSERTSLGSVVKNAVGYVIMVQGDKFKVYNPYKAMIGIYSDLEQAKRRVQRDEPKQ